MPDTLSPATHKDLPVCPCSWFEDLQLSRNRDPKGPLWQPAFGHNMEEVLTTIGNIQQYDGDENVFVILAHDPSVRSSEVPFFPEPINDWKQKGLGQKLKWVWVGEVMAAITE